MTKRQQLRQVTQVEAFLRDKDRWTASAWLRVPPDAPLRPQMCLVSAWMWVAGQPVTAGRVTLDELFRIRDEATNEVAEVLQVPSPMYINDCEGYGTIMGLLARARWRLTADLLDELLAEPDADDVDDRDLALA